MDTAGDADLDIRLGLALLERTVLGDYVGKLVIDEELVGVGVGVLGLAELVDGARADLEVLLYGMSDGAGDRAGPWGTDVGRQFFLVQLRRLGVGRLVGDLGLDGGGGSLLSL